MGLYMHLHTQAGLSLGYITSHLQTDRASSAADFADFMSFGTCPERGLLSTEYQALLHQDKPAWHPAPFTGESKLHDIHQTDGL